jgi:hypothetical protein
MVKLLEIYKGIKNSIKGPIIAVIIISALILGNFYLLKISFASIIISIILLLLWVFAYNGIVLRISIDETRIVVVRPITRTNLNINDIVFCAVHGIDEDKSLIYAFMKKRKKGIMSVKGIKPIKPFEEIVKIISDENTKAELDVNFNMASKIPVSFVEAGEKLKYIILARVNENQNKILKEQP